MLSVRDAHARVIAAFEALPAEEVAKRRAEFDKVKQTALEQRKKAGVA